MKKYINNSDDPENIKNIFIEKCGSFFDELDDEDLMDTSDKKNKSFNDLVRKDYGFSCNIESWPRYYPVRKMTFAYYDKSNIDKYFKLLKGFLRRNLIKLNFDDKNPGIITLFVALDNEEEYEMLNKQLVGFESVFPSMNFGIVEFSDIDIKGNEKINTKFDTEVKRVIRNYISKTLVNRALNNDWHSTRQHILLADKPELLKGFKDGYITEADCVPFDKECDIMIGSTCNSILEGTYFKVTDSYSRGYYSTVNWRNYAKHKRLPNRRDCGDIMYMVKVIDNTEIQIDSYIIGNRNYLPSGDGIGAIVDPVFSEVPLETCSYILGFREYFVRIKNSNNILHYSENNDNFEVYTMEEDSNNILVNTSNKGLICIYDSRDIDHQKFLEHEHGIRQDCSFYDDALKLFKSRKNGKKMVK